MGADGSQRAPIHLVIGHAGAGLSFTVTPQKPAFMEVVLLEHGYMRVQANGTALSFQVPLASRKWWTRGRVGGKGKVLPNWCVSEPSRAEFCSLVSKWGRGGCH